MLAGELQKFKGIPETAASIYALSGSLSLMSGDFKNMRFGYTMALKRTPSNLRIRYNFIVDLLFAGYVKAAREQLMHAVSILHADSIETHVMAQIYRQLDRLVMLPQCREVLSMMNDLPNKAPDLKQWIAEKEELLTAYRELNIDVAMVQKFLDEVYSKIAPKFPVEPTIKHYYEPEDHEICYVFVDTKSDADTLFELDREITEFIVYFEEQHNVDLYRFLPIYGAW